VSLVCSSRTHTLGLGSVGITGAGTRNRGNVRDVVALDILSQSC
jgi:hypothetical protein